MAANLKSQAGSSGNLGAAVKKGTTEQHTHIIIRDSSVPDSKSSRGAKVDPEDFFNTPFDDNGNRMDSQLSCMNTMI